MVSSTSSISERPTGFVKMAEPLSPSDVNGRRSTNRTPGPPLADAFSEKYPTWVKSSLIPGSRDEAPSLEELCKGLIRTLDEAPPCNQSATDEKPLKLAPTPAPAKHQSETVVSESLGQRPACEAEFSDPDQARSAKPAVLDDSLCKAFPAFTTYAHLDILGRHSQENLRAIAAKIKEIQLQWMDEERVTATWVTPNLLLDGILGSIDPKTLQALCKTHNFKHVVMISIHPDDWVAGEAWKAHGRLQWTKRPSSAQERASGVCERLVAPLWDHQPERSPQIIVQNDVEYPSPVVDQLIIPLEDGDGSLLLMQLPDICTFINQHNRPDSLMVMHCKVGLSRSNAAQEAFVLHAAYRELRKNAKWLQKDTNEKQADLQMLCQTYHKAVKRRRPDLKSKFPKQMANWAKYLADDEPDCGPDFAIDQSSPGGNDMRDAAITACYELGYLLPPNLIQHYSKRTAAGTETAQKTIRRFQKAEQELQVGDCRPNATPWLSLVQFVTLCERLHTSREGA